MKVVVRSSSLVFTLLSIILQVPITRVKRQTTQTQPEPPAANGWPASKSTYSLNPRAPG